MRLSNEHQVILIEMAKEEILNHLSRDRKWPKKDRDIPDSLKITCGVFVSIYVENHLRGCIGTFSEEEPLYRNVKKMAISAAFHDTRFRPLNKDETDKFSIEISVLSPRKLIKGPEDIKIGRDGIYIKKGMNRGTFLPQVAVNQQWNAEEFLGNCAKYKAGLDWNGWKSAELYTYQACIFDSGKMDG